MKFKYDFALVSGGFDPVHVGHLRMFKDAQSLSNKVVILLNNVYQPNNPTEVTPNDNIQQKPSKGEFIYETSIPGRSTQESQSLVYAKNKYNNGEGSEADALTMIL